MILLKKKKQSSKRRPNIKLLNEFNIERIPQNVKTIVMLKNILSLEGSQEISASEQKTILGTNVNEITSKCDSWNSMIYEDCTEYYPELTYANAN